MAMLPAEKQKIMTNTNTIQTPDHQVRVLLTTRIKQLTEHVSLQKRQPHESLKLVGQGDVF